MRPSNKSRSRNKSSSNRRSNNTSGNIVNRVFDSVGPEGRVRGTPQQIIEKYRSLAHDALLGDDRVAAESFQQHAEHYSRILQVAQREINERLAEQQAQQAQQAERQAEQQARQSRPRTADSRRPELCRQHRYTPSPWRRYLCSSPPSYWTRTRPARVPWHAMMAEAHQGHSQFGQYP